METRAMNKVRDGLDWSDLVSFEIRKQREGIVPMISIIIGEVNKKMIFNRSFIDLHASLMASHRYIIPFYSKGNSAIVMKFEEGFIKNKTLKISVSKAGHASWTLNSFLKKSGLELKESLRFSDHWEELPGLGKCLVLYLPKPDQGESDEK